MNKKEYREKVIKGNMPQESVKDIDLSKVSKLRDRYLTKRDNNVQKIINEYMACKNSLIEFDEIVKDCEIKIKRAEKGKATRLRSLEAAIREFEAKDESNTTDEDRVKFYKNVMEYSKKTAPNMLKAKKRRSRKTKAELLEETKQKIAETIEKIRQCEEKMTIYEMGKSHEDLMIEKLNSVYQRIQNGESWDEIKSSKINKKTDKVISKDDKKSDNKEEKETKRKDEDQTKKSVKEDNSKKEEKESIEEYLRKKEQEEKDRKIGISKPSSQRFELDALEARNKSNKKSEEKCINPNKDILILRFRDAVFAAREKGITDREIRNFILYKSTSGMNSYRAYYLSRIATLVNRYDGDLNELIETIFDGNTLYPALRFEDKHPIIAKIPLLGRIITEISNRRMQIKEIEAQRVIYNKETVSDELEEKRDEFITSIRIEGIPGLEARNTNMIRKMPEKQLSEK